MKTTESGVHDQPIEIAAHADAALRIVRVVLAVLSILLIGAYRPLAGQPSWISLTATLAAIIVALAALNTMSLRMPDSRRWAALLQALDVVAAVALAVALDEPLDHQSWVLLVVPVVSAAVRLGALASVLSWIGGCAGYLAAAYLGAIGAHADVGLVTRVPGTLLAVAITIGLLARWMREGWEIQNEVTAVIADRERRLSVLEQTRHALTNTEPEEALTLCASQALALGFAAVTVHHLSQDSPPLVVGQGDIVAATDPSQHDASHGPVVTAWTDGAQILSRSVTAHEPQTNTLIAGWSRAPIEHDQVRALATLVAITSDSIETATLLRQLRYAADHDPLTGLLNRGALHRKLAEVAGNPGQLSIAFIDLDDSKHINDTHGHDSGDKALIAIARRLEAVVGTSGIISRYRGYEFVAVFPDTSLEDAQRFAQAALQATSGPVALGPAQLDVQLSIGIAATQTPIDPSKLLHAAYDALYQAKSAGKATYTAIDLQAFVPPSPLADAALQSSTK